MISTTNKGEGGLSGFCTSVGGGGEFNAFINNNNNNDNNNVVENPQELIQKGGKLGINNNGGNCGLKKGPWTAEEDTVLMEYVRKHGEGNWNAVQRNSGLNRCGKSCRLRWANHLRPNLKKGSFTPQEERLIIELHAKMGNKWARMANMLPGRTDNEIKNYWNTRIKRHQRQGLPLYPPDIQPRQCFQTPPDSYHQFPPVTNSFAFQSEAEEQVPHQDASSSINVLPLFEYPQHHQQHQHNHYSDSTPSTPFTFQTQKIDPFSTHVSPIPSPCSISNNNSNNNNNMSHHHIPTLAFLDFSFPRPTPIQQSANRFKRFASCGDIANSVVETDNNHVPHSHHFPSVSTAPPLPPHHPIHSPNNNNNNITHFRNSHHQPQRLYDNNNNNLLLSSIVSSDQFHQEIQKENEEMCSLLATMSRQLPSNHNYGDVTMLHTGQFNTTQFDKDSEHDENNINNMMRMRNKDKAHNILYATTIANGGSMYGGLLEDLWQEANANLVVHNNNNLLFMQQGHHDQVNDEDNDSFLPPIDQNNNITKTDISDDDELSKLIEDNETNHLKFCGEGGDQIGSNDPSSVVTTEDRVNFDLHHMFSFLPTTTDLDKPPLKSCSWDNLPEIC